MSILLDDLDVTHTVIQPRAVGSDLLLEPTLFEYLLVPALLLVSPFLTLFATIFQEPNLMWRKRFEEQWTKAVNECVGFAGPHVMPYPKEGH